MNAFERARLLKKKNNEIEESSGNVFDDLDVDDPYEYHDDKPISPLCIGNDEHYNDNQPISPLCIRS